ncbi:hypothetical protein SAMD00019534_120560 [Acytostelium subglobosum LB1]|uniref:hypothetical protein n=1 Tax=Acytostelium subglobosum LB1 TaxID=1410327 RepID=UPI0006447F66|nr:hypothetical protein SAMD00019534_120560 [Acytostelium subglobosum LB1]GAM28880.1 hypothetical protein SAMD00019534_120560 [Acytostelium subglobosum LB1]|eukprot:XP_012748252.1 hypothetical protein SAMD00019534_120560 [Acytostelium subglobosum LB1]
MGVHNNEQEEDGPELDMSPQGIRNRAASNEILRRQVKELEEEERKRATYGEDADEENEDEDEDRNDYNDDVADEHEFDEDYEDQLEDYHDGEGEGDGRMEVARLQARRKLKAEEDELDSLSRLSTNLDNPIDPDTLSPQQLERVVYDAEGKIIPPEKVTARDIYLHLVRKYRAAPTKEHKREDAFNDVLFDDDQRDLTLLQNSMDKDHINHSSSKEYKRMKERNERLQQRELLMEQAAEQGAENIEKYRVNPRLEDLRAKKAAKATEDKSSSEYMLKRLDEMERNGEFSEPVTRSPTTGKEVLGNKKYPKCLLCYDYGWKMTPMNVPLLSVYLNKDGDILPRYITGNCLKHQKKIARKIKHAKHLGLFSYKNGRFTIYDPNVVPPTAKEQADYTRWYNGDFTDEDWFGNEPTEEVDTMESPIDTDKERQKYKESLMLDLGISEAEANHIMAGKFFKIKSKEGQ